LALAIAGLVSDIMLERIAINLCTVRTDSTQGQKALMLSRFYRIRLVTENREALWPSKLPVVIIIIKASQLLLGASSLHTPNI
jgi:hypothetical protein